MTNLPSRLNEPVTRSGLTTQYQTNAAITARLIASKMRSATNRQSSMTSGPILGAGENSSPEVTHRTTTSTQITNHTTPMAARNVAGPCRPSGGGSDTACFSATASPGPAVKDISHTSSGQSR